MSNSPLWLRLAKRSKSAVLQQPASPILGPGLSATFSTAPGQSDLTGGAGHTVLSCEYVASDCGHYNPNPTSETDKPPVLNATTAAVTAAVVTAAVYSPDANASIVNDLTEAITKAISKPLEQMSKLFTDTFSGIMDKGNQEKIVAVAKGFDSINEMVKYSYNQRQFAESQPDPLFCDASERATAGSVAQREVSIHKSILSTESTNSDINTSKKVPNMVRAKQSNLITMMKLFKGGQLSFNNISPTVLQGRINSQEFGHVDASSPSVQTHSPESAKLANAYIETVRAPLDARVDTIDISLLEKGDIRESSKLVSVAAKKARVAMLMLPLTDELAERLPIAEANGKSKRELIHEGIANTYYSEEYNQQLSELAAPTPALIAIAKSLSYSNMLAFETLLNVQQQNKLIATLGAESMERNNSERRSGRGYV